MKQSIITLKDVGEKREALYKKLNIHTLEDLILYFPRDYEDRSNIRKFDELILNEKNTVVGKITKLPENISVNGKIMTRLILSDGSSNLVLTWFNRPYLKKFFKLNHTYIFYGSVSEKFNNTQMDSPDYEILESSELLNNGRIVPIYQTTRSLTQTIIRKNIKYILENYSFQFEEAIPQYIRDKYDLSNKKFAIKNIHFPESDESFFRARARLVFEEFFMVQLSLRKLKNKTQIAQSNIILEDLNCEELKSLLPYNLTNAQNKVLNEVIGDIEKKIVINRLIQGDVGSGKTAIALLTSYLLIKNGYQASVMVPTEVLANQHFNYFKSFFEMLNIKTVLLSSSLKKKEKDSVLEDIKTGDAQMIIGTHAIIQERVLFKNLGMVITDEQHRFGVKQREAFLLKGATPHVLVMTATPIPRTLALILYGDLDVSIIDELPPNRQKIDTFYVTSKYQERIYKFIEKEVAAGRQCYVVCPSIETNEKMKELKSVIGYTEKLREMLPSISFSYIHGKMKQDEKEILMNDFKDNKINVIVSTTVIEVGIDVPNATLMIVENAERFGLSQLHQLRGRVGRGKHKSYCILISDSKNKYSKERLRAMVDSDDGFVISELDLKLRGLGDFFGTRQHGLPEFKIANIYRDIEVLKTVQGEIQNFNVNNLSEEEKNILSKHLYDFFDVEKILL